MLPNNIKNLFRSPFNGKAILVRTNLNGDVISILPKVYKDSWTAHKASLGLPGRGEIMRVLPASAQ